MLLIKETFTNSEDKFRITDLATEMQREKMPFADFLCNAIEAVFEG